MSRPRKSPRQLLDRGTRMIATAYRDAARSRGGRLARPLPIVVEAANIDPLRDLDRIATCRSSVSVVNSRCRMGRLGLEPRTLGLKVPCSTS